MQDCVYQTPVQDVTDLKQRLTDTWNGLLQSILDDADDEWLNGGRDLAQGLREGKGKTF